jgi:hypothetical protein
MWFIKFSKHYESQREKGRKWKLGKIRRSAGMGAISIRKFSE